MTEGSPTPAERAPRSLYKYATWAHVGHGADDCSEVDEETGTSLCGDSAHFHAFCRLPNPLQEEKLRDRALAAKARKIRQLRLDGTDSNEILETEIELLQGEPDAKDRMANEVVGADWAQDYLAAVREARDFEDEDEDKPYAHIEDDRKRYDVLQGVPEADRSQDEYDELQRHLAAYEEKVREHYEATTNPKRETYQAMDDLALVDLVRRKRVERIGQEEFARAYSVNEWLSCTYTQRADGKPSFRDLDHLEGSDAAVLLSLQEIFADLEQTHRDAEGN